MHANNLGESYAQVALCAALLGCAKLQMRGGCMSKTVLHTLACSRHACFTMFTIHQQVMTTPAQQPVLHGPEQALHAGHSRFHALPHKQDSITVGQCLCGRGGKRTLRALVSCCSEAETWCRRRLKRSISCPNTTPREFTAPATRATVLVQVLLFAMVALHDMNSAAPSSLDPGQTKLHCIYCHKSCRHYFAGQ